MFYSMLVLDDIVSDVYHYIDFNLFWMYLFIDICILILLNNKR